MSESVRESRPMRREDDGGVLSMTTPEAAHVRVELLDAETTSLVWLAAVLSGGSEADIRTALTAAVGVVRVA